MRVWDKVYSIENIKFTVNDGQEEATVYGNSRNCVALTVYFNGKDVKGQTVDLSKEKFDQKDVQLINQGTGEELPREFANNTDTGIRYSTTSNMYCLQPVARSAAPPGSSDTAQAKRAKVTYYIYAQSRAEFVKTVGARFVFYDSDKVKPYDTTQDNRTSQFAKIRVLPEVRYGMGDIEPVKWVESARFNNYAVQWDLYVKLNDKHPHNKWIYAEFDNIKKLSKPAHHETIFAEQNNPHHGYYYMLWPIGPEVEFDLLDSNEKFWMKVKYNKVHGALNMVLTRGWRSDQEVKPDAIIRLYDVFGNEGRFRVDWINYIEDHTGPSIAAAN